MIRRREMMQQVQSGGGGRLPDAFQEVEYIGKDTAGGPYINTGITAVATTIDVQSKHAFVESADCYMMGVRSSNNSTQFCFCGYYSWNNQFAYPSYYYVSFPQQYTMGREILIDAHFEQGNQTVYVDGVLESTRNNTTAMNVDLPFYLFGRNNNGTIGNQPKKCKIYYWKITKNGTLVRDYVPCYRKSDNEIGLYDLVSNSFFPNDGTGSFTKGANA